MVAASTATTAKELARAQFLEEQRLARARGATATAIARRATDAAKVAEELERLQARERVVRGARAGRHVEAPPDSRGAWAKAALRERRLEAAFEGLVA